MRRPTAVALFAGLLLSAASVGRPDQTAPPPIAPAPHGAYAGTETCLKCHTRPAIDRFATEWPRISRDMAPMIGAMSDNLDTPAALEVADGWADHALAGEPGDASAPGVLARALDALLGVRL